MVEFLNNVMAGPAAVKASTDKGIKAYVMALWGLVLVLLILMIVGFSTFENKPNNIRRYVVGQEGWSLDDKINSNSKSGLTGSRDAPVFFSDFNVEMVRDGQGNLNPTRESFSGEKDDVTNIEQRFMVN